MNRQKEGISLIVLVITIIVMIILAAAVVISLNNSNVINSANKAVNASDYNNVKTAADLAYSEYIINKANTNVEEYINSKLQTDEVISEDGSDYYIKMSGNQVNVVKAGSLVDLFYKGDVKIGDYVSYKSGTQTVDTEGYVSLRETVTKTTVTYASNNSIAWRVLGADGNKLKLVSENVVKTSDSQGLTLYGAYSYLYCKKILDKACSAFLNSEYAVLARSINVEDIDQVSGFAKETSICTGSMAAYWDNVTFQIPYGTKLSYDGVSSASFLCSEGRYVNVNLPIIAYPDATKENYKSQGKNTFTFTDYNYDGAELIDNQVAYNMLFKDSSSNNLSYWLASSSVSLNDGYVRFNVKHIYYGKVQGDTLFMGGGDGRDYFDHPSSNFDEYNSAAIRPVVLLKENITGGYNTQEQIWELK